MKKNYAIAILLVLNMSIKAQSYMGYLTDNYSGVHGVISNPAAISDSRFKTDINLVGVSALAGNDYYAFKFKDIFNDDFDLEEDANTFPEEKNHVFGNIDVLGPSFMFNLNEKSALAIFTRGRAFYNINELNGLTAETLDDGIDENTDFTINEGDTYLTTNAWAEIGVTYSRVLMNKEQHFLKGGISLKYLQGLGNGYAAAENLSIDYDAADLVAGSSTLGSVTTTGELAYGYSENLEDDADDFEIVSGATGFGVDFGMIYEWRPDYESHSFSDDKGTTYSYKDVNKYKLKFGVSVTDIGAMNYKGTEEKYSINNATISEEDFDAIDAIDELENFYTILSAQDLEKVVLPTALHVNVDWNINQKFYLNLNSDLALTSKTKANTNSIINGTSLTPRFESKWFSFYSPLSLVQHSGFQWGAGLRAGPLYVGSGSIVSALIGSELKAADAYVGLKIPVYQSRPKDKDEDGVLDKVDKCPETKGPTENFGCPWPDTDGDTVLDKDDKCPEEIGAAENQGCPWPDTDGDGLLDKEDPCPQNPGPAENEGCPWSDSDEDGVIDKNDDCVDVPGTMANKGCPEVPVVTEEVQKTLNSYAKTILFDSGKSSIKAASDQVLKDILAILQEYATAKFVIEGHTDSSGSSTYNQKLSNERAEAVKSYLTQNGIDALRLSYAGYGEDQPISSNKTKEGRSQNRRVEINLVK